MKKPFARFRSLFWFSSVLFHVRQEQSTTSHYQPPLPHKTRIGLPDRREKQVYSPFFVYLTLPSKKYMQFGIATDTFLLTSDNPTPTPQRHVMPVVSLLLFCFLCLTNSFFYYSEPRSALYLYTIQATMLKKIKSRRRMTEPHIAPAMLSALASQPSASTSSASAVPQPSQSENGDRDKEPTGGT